VGFTLNRIAIVLMVLTLGRVALNGVMGNVLVIAMGAAAAAAFAGNWPIELSRPLRIAAFAIQILTIVAITAAVALLMFLAEAGTTVWAEVPWWFWVIVAAVVFIIYKATAPGFALLKEKL
jgi:hypothetical protein